MMKMFFALTILLITVSVAYTQFREETDLDSLQKIINNPHISDADKINPLARISRLYANDKNDSVSAERYMQQAMTLARQQKDSNYLIYVYCQQLTS